MTVVNSDQPIPSTASRRPPGPAASGAAAAAGVVNRQRRHDDRPDVWRLAHRALRGRYRLALGLAFINRRQSAPEQHLAAKLELLGGLVAGIDSARRFQPFELAFVQIEALGLELIEVRRRM